MDGLQDVTETKARLLAEHRKGANSRDFLKRLGEVVAGPLQRVPEDVELLLAHAQAAWIADQRDPIAARARDSAQRLITLVPDLADGYRLLGLAHLSRREYRDAFLALSAVKTIASPVNLDNFRALARLLMTDVPKVSFEWGGQRYAFDLTTHNAAAIESSAFHSIGMLTEAEELQFLGTILDPARIKRVVEVGVLLGNHSAYFLKTLRPEALTLIDADPANLPFIEHTVSYNSAPARPAVTIHNAFVGTGVGEVTFAGAKVPMRPLADLVQGPVDFLKVDVDGGEESLLKGAAPVIEASRPVVMIETTPASHAAVEAWFAARRYAVTRVFDHGGYRNVVLAP